MMLRVEALICEIIVKCLLSSLVSRKELNKVFLWCYWA